MPSPHLNPGQRYWKVKQDKGRITIEEAICVSDDRGGLCVLRDAENPERTLRTNGQYLWHDNKRDAVWEMVCCNFTQVEYHLYHQEEELRGRQLRDQLELWAAAALAGLQWLRLQEDAT